jgi:hypothetical protein
MPIRTRRIVRPKGYLAQIFERIQHQYYNIDFYRLSYRAVAWKICIRETQNNPSRANQLMRAVQNHRERVRKKEGWKDWFEQKFKKPIGQIISDAKRHQELYPPPPDD